MIQMGFQVSFDELSKERLDFLKGGFKEDFFSYFLKKKRDLITDLNRFSDLENQFLQIQKIFLENTDSSLVVPHVGSVDLLKSLSQKYHLYLVTAGNTEVQMKKVIAAQIKKFFKKIYIVGDQMQFEDKKEAFVDILKFEQCESQNVICIGDRLDVEIRQGNELGFSTIHLAQGDHRIYYPKNPLELADYEFDSIEQLNYFLLNKL